MSNVFSSEMFLQVKRPAASRLATAFPVWPVWASYWGAAPSAPQSPLRDRGEQRSGEGCTNGTPCCQGETENCFIFRLHAFIMRLVEMLFSQYWNQFLAHVLGLTAVGLLTVWVRPSHCVSLCSCVDTQRGSHSLSRFLLGQLTTDQSDHTPSIRYTGSKCSFFFSFVCPFNHY